MAKEAVGSVDLDAVVNLDDMERAAERVMDRQDFDYFAGGASPAPSRHPSDRSSRSTPWFRTRRIEPRGPRW